jgi:Beta-lactamase enzyme family
MTLAEDVDDLLDGCPGSFGIYARNLTTGDTVGVNEDRVFPAESRIKTAILLHYERCVDAGGGAGGSSTGPSGTVFATGVAGDPAGNGLLPISYRRTRGNDDDDPDHHATNTTTTPAPVAVEVAPTFTG